MDPEKDRDGLGLGGRLGLEIRKLSRCFLTVAFISYRAGVPRMVIRLSQTSDNATWHSSGTPYPDTSGGSTIGFALLRNQSWMNALAQEERRDKE